MSRVHQLTAWDEFRLWLTLDETLLGMDLVTYYGFCCVVGLLQGISIGNWIVCYVGMR